MEESRVRAGTDDAGVTAADEDDSEASTETIGADRALTRRSALAATGSLLSAGTGLSLSSGATNAQEDSDSGETIVVAPDGSDSNDGTEDEPLATMREAIRERAEPGDTVAFRGGEYTEQFLVYFAAGELGAPIAVEAYEDEDVAFVGDHRHRIRAPHIRVRGIEFRDGQGVVVAKSRSRDVRFYDCESHENTRDGFAISEGAHDVEFHRCKSHHNYDTPISSEEGNRNADGFNITLRAYNIRFYGCEAWHNVDDGFDTNRAGFGIELHGCRTWKNGLNPREEPVGNGVGIKIQNGRDNALDEDPENPTLNVRCVTWNNVSDGQRFYRTGGECYAVNCTAFENGDDDYQSRDYGGGANQYYYLNCISAGSGTVELDADEQVERANTWTLGIDEPGLRRTGDPTAAGFARLEAGSPCIDAGSTATGPATIDVADGDPDLGAYEYESEGQFQEYEIVLSSTDGGAAYEFSVAGEVRWGSDEITADGSSASGRVWDCCTDQYRYTGALSRFSADPEITISIQTVD